MHHVLKDDPSAMQQYHQLQQLLDSQTGSNFYKWFHNLGRRFRVPLAPRHRLCLGVLGLLEIWPAILHFHYADIKPSLLWEVPIRVGVMPFLIGALLSSLSATRSALRWYLAVAPAITFLLNGVLQQTQFEWWDIGLWCRRRACSAAGA